ncbi:hypothetical protein OG455_30550 [Kitasatospora sp. NBC_01287]|uniref:hypothetical protein n=1 Tax=Kitasatospora sp. NBC_01287 TaxID=2903573 RepID=UPI00224F7B35|nr:hypothetical protein [Kitasatospora sp. NBC_01287]MCX4749805.1 hypothetical protein [Kitasatospora sp. NBC_01287]
MADLVVQPQPAAGLPHVDTTLSYAQLHERACVVCGSSVPPLVSVGHRTVDGLTWAVAACAAHAGEAR